MALRRGKRIFAVASASLLALGNLSCRRPDSVATPPLARQTSAPAAPRSASAPSLHFDVGAIDAKADPCSDFYDYACGGWRASHPIPPDRTKWTRYAEMDAVNLEREREIVEDASRLGAKATAPERRVGTYYAACMDESGIEARGLAPIRDRLAAIDRVRTAREAVDALVDLHAHGVEALFSVYPSTDPQDSKRRMLWLDGGRLGLPDPSDYANVDEAAGALRARYVEHLRRLFLLIGLSTDDAKTAATRVLAFETSLASKALSARDLRRREKQEHPMTLAELRSRFPSIDWPGYFAKLGAAGIARINVAQPAWLDAVNSALGAADSAGLRDYLRVQAVRPFATMLPSAIEAEVFDFHQRTLRGVQEMAPRWRRCLRLLDGDLGDDVGRIFVARYFDDAARARTNAMIDALMVAYKDVIETADWLGPSARDAALAKLSTTLIVTGQSNRPRSFDGLEVVADDAFGNAWRAKSLEVKRILSALATSVDRQEFFDALPQELDGFGSKTMNATGFTAGFLQPPVFDAHMDDAVNFGGLGGVIGHELSHQFDDEGRKYDASGNPRSWWSAEDVARFEERARCFVGEYSRFGAEDGTPVDGELTLGENIADNAGLRLSYRALRPSEAGPKIDGFTPAQRFFLAWGQIRCENVRPEAAKRRATSDEHSPGRWRVNGVVSNMPEFATAFACAAGTPMAPTKRCAVW